MGQIAADLEGAARGRWRRWYGGGRRRLSGALAGRVAKAVRLGSSLAFSSNATQPVGLST